MNLNHHLSKKLLIIIPARKNSKGIPEKNKVVINQKPLIFYAINNAKSIHYPKDICVTTDDEEIIEYAHFLRIDALSRSPELCEDHVPLAPVVFDAFHNMEKIKNTKYAIVILMQPTSPTLTAKTLEAAIDTFIAHPEIDTLLSGVEMRHLFWLKDRNNQYALFQPKRVNRQQIDPIFLETGAFFITKAENVLQENFIGKNLQIYPVPSSEALDIDNRIDIAIARAHLQQKRILICVIGSSNTGLGHVFRTISLARWLSSQEITFVTTKENNLAINIINKHHYQLEIIDEWDQINSILHLINPNIIINDLLDTQLNYMIQLEDFQKIAPQHVKIINFEDLGIGNSKADVVINALYETTINQPNHYYGYKYVCMKEMFRYLPYKKIDQINNILITFGGTDPSNLTENIVYEMISMLEKYSRDLQVEVIIGPGFSLEKVNLLKSLVHHYNENHTNPIEFRQDVKEMAIEMFKNDLVISSNGRTVYEATALGLPLIVFSQNEREDLHLFSKFSKSIEYLGRFSSEKLGMFRDLLIQFLDNPKLIQERNQYAIQYGKEIREGIVRIVNLIQNL